MSVPRILFFVLVCFLVSSFRGTAKKTSKGFDPQRVFTVRELQEDFRVLRKQVEKKQPNLYVYTSKARMDVVFDSLYAGIRTPMNLYEFYSYITPLVSFIKDGHTILLPGEEVGNYNDIHSVYIPLHICCIDGKLFSDMNCSADTNLFDGAEIISINGQSSEDIQQQFLIRMMRDGENEGLPHWLMNNYFRGFYGILHAFPQTYTISYIGRDGRVQAKNINGLPLDSIVAVKKRKYAARLLSQQQRQGISLHFVPGSKAAVLTIESFDPDIISKQRHQDFSRLIKKFFARLDSARTENLILDVRDNMGGDPAYGVLLLKYLMPEKFEYAEACYRTRRWNAKGRRERLTECHVPGFGKGTFQPERNAYKGKLTVLINGGSFSATAELVSVLDRYKRAVFVGEETGGSKVIDGGTIISHKVILPHTKIVCSPGTEATLMRPLSENDGHGTLPDYLVRNSIADLLNNRDAVLQFALQLAQQ